MWEKALRETDIFMVGEIAAGEAEILADRLAKAGMTVRIVCVEEENCAAADGAPYPSGGEGRLVVTDDADTAKRLVAAEIPVLGCLTKENQGADFSGVAYLAESIADLETEYLERVYRRQKNLPWYILTTDRLVLRETVEEDLDAFYRIYDAPSVTRFMENLYADREEERTYISAYRENIYEFYGFGMWTVLLRVSGEIIGRAGIDMCIGEEYPDLGFVIGSSWQENGYAYEACDAILRYAKDVLEMDLIQARCEPENAASARLLKKLGFVMDKRVMREEKEYLLFLRNL